MNIVPLLARRTRGLKPSPIRKLNPLMRLPGMISLGGGYPNAQTFALTSAEVVFKSGRRFQIRDEAMDLACQYGPTDAKADLKPHLLNSRALPAGSLRSRPIFVTFKTFYEVIKVGGLNFARLDYKAHPPSGMPADSETAGRAGMAPRYLS